jgi:hypothetical protein
MEPWVRSRTRLQLACGHTVHTTCWDGDGCVLCFSEDRDMHRQVVSFSMGVCVGIVSLMSAAAVLLW